jgi:hypothetical protein
MMAIYIPSANTVRARQDTSGFDKAVQCVLRDIERAQQAGKLSTCFSPYPSEYYDAVKQAFAANGYTFTPTGYIGGVWQRTENINW